MLKIENLHKIYGKYHALSGLDMTVKEGALYGFVGPNGAGKTTAIKIMTGLLQAEEGSVLINGKDALADPDQLKSCIGYVPDFFGVYDNLTVGEYMSFFASCYQLDGLVARKRYTALLEQVGLEDKLDFYVDGLSRGMKQRLCLARALIHDPQILILDEPTNHMDIQAKETLESAFQAYEGTILFVSHDRYFIRQVAKSVLIFENNAAFYYPFGYEHYLERKEKEASGEPLAARIKAEEQALIEGLKAVPRAERHRLREIPQEEAYDQWRLRLAAEAIENAAECAAALYQQILEKNTGVLIIRELPDTVKLKETEAEAYSAVWDLMIKLEKSLPMAYIFYGQDSLVEENTRYDEIGIFLPDSLFLKNLERHVKKAEAIIYAEE